jgi:hypothetical protein
MTRLAAVALAALLAQNPDARQVEVRPAVVIGQVIDAATGRAVRQAIVRITGGDVTVTRVADERGRFYFRNLPPGTYDITAMRDGYFDGAFGRVRAGGDALELPLAAGEWKTNITISLFRPAVISGAIDDEASEPLAGIRVVAFRRTSESGRDEWATARMTATDDRGLYRLHGLMPGEYVAAVLLVQATMPMATMEAAAETGRSTSDIFTVAFMNRGSEALSTFIERAGVDRDDRNLRMNGNAPPPPPESDRALAYPTVFYPAGDDPASAVTIDLGPGEERAGVSFRLKPVPVARVSGRVEGPDGPVEGLMLRLLREGAADFGAGAETAVTVSAPDGSFTLLDVPAGSYVLSLRSAAAALRGWPPSPSATPASTAITLSGGTELWGTVPVTVYADDVSGLVVNATKGIRLSGTVVFEASSEPEQTPAATNVTIELVSEDGRAADVPPGPVGEDGSFTIAGVRPGRYTLRAGTVPAGWYLKSVAWFGQDVLKDPLYVSLGTDVEAITITLTDRPARVSGSVYNNFGLAVPGARVVAVPAGRRAGLDPDARAAEIRSTRANVYGVFELVGLFAGDYDLVAVAEEADIRWQDPGVLSRLVGPAARVTVAEGGTAERSIRVSRPPRR